MNDLSSVRSCRPFVSLISVRSYQPFVSYPSWFVYKVSGMFWGERETRPIVSTPPLPHNTEPNSNLNPNPNLTHPYPPNTLYSYEMKVDVQKQGYTYILQDAFWSCLVFSFVLLQGQSSFLFWFRFLASFSVKKSNTSGTNVLVFPHPHSNLTLTLTIIPNLIPNLTFTSALPNTSPST